jgi:hypothetical protein
MNHFQKYYHSAEPITQDYTARFTASLTNGDWSFLKCNFEVSAQVSQGSAIYISANLKFQLVQCVFQNCIATPYAGGAVYFQLG